MSGSRPPGGDEATLEPVSEARTTETEVVVAPMLADESRPILTLLTGVNAGQVFAIERAQTIIGRAREAWVRVDAAGISRKHARVVRTSPSTFTVEDLASTNGVYVNGTRVQTATLTSGDQLQIGSEVVLRFSLVDDAEEMLARQLYEASTRDVLTGAYNRKYFVARLESEVAFAERHKLPLGLLMFNLDFFKRVNDTHGHVAGDAMLRTVGVTVARLLRAEDVFARYGGEEFVILARGTSRDNLRRLAERVRKAVADARVPWGEAQLQITLSVGVGLLDECLTGGAKALVALADGRLYRAKESGRDRAVVD